MEDIAPTPKVADTATETKEVEFATTDRHKIHGDVENDPHRAALEDNPEVPEALTWSKGLSIFFLGLSYMSSISCGFLMVSNLLVPIGEALGEAQSVGWVASSWALTSAVAMSLGGSISDVFGRRHVVMTGQALNIVGAIIAATAKATITVIAGSSIIGFGCGFIFAAYAGIQELLPNKYRGAGLSWTEVCINVPFGIFATLIGYQLDEHVSWRWVYYLSTIIAAVCLCGTALVYFPPARPRHDFEKSRRQEVLELDYLGYFFYTTGLTVFLIGLSWAGQPEHPWTSSSVIAPIALGTVTLIVVFTYEWTVPIGNPFLPFHLFRMVREFTVLLMALFVAGMVFYSSSTLLVQATATVYGGDPLQLGISMIPNGAGLFFGGAVLPAFIHKVKHLKLQVVVAMVVQLVFASLYSYGVMLEHKGAWMACQFFGAASFGWVTTLAYVSASLHVPLRDLGLAAGLVGTFRGTGGSVGITVFTTIRDSVVSSQLGPRIEAAAMAAGFPDDGEGLKSLVEAAVSYAAQGDRAAFAHVQGATTHVVKATLEAYRAAYISAYQRVFYSFIPFCVLAVIAALFVKDASRYLTNHTAVHMEKEILDGDRHKRAMAVDIEGPDGTPL